MLVMDRCTISKQPDAHDSKLEIPSLLDRAGAHDLCFPVSVQIKTLPVPIVFLQVD